jgi:hypothetical protein
VSANLTAINAPPSLYWKPGDEAARRVAVFDHDLRHRAYRKAATLLGVSFGAASLSSTTSLDRDWFARHGLIHISLKSLFPATIGEAMPDLMDTVGEKDPNFSDWQRRHALVHARLDAAFGIV